MASGWPVTEPFRLPRFYPILNTATVQERGFPAVQAAAAWLEGGARIVQFRHKTHWSRTVFETASEIAQLCQKAQAQLIVNDRADIAMLLGAGLHIGQDDLPPLDARRILGPGAVIGFSSHNIDQVCAAAAEPVNYVAFGPLYPTTSKRNPDPVAGIERLKECRALVNKPLVAIGGITRETAPAILAAGADAIAVIGDLIPSILSSQSLRARMEEWQRLLAP